MQHIYRYFLDNAIEIEEIECLNPKCSAGFGLWKLGQLFTLLIRYIDGSYSVDCINDNLVFPNEQASAKWRFLVMFILMEQQ